MKKFISVFIGLAISLMAHSQYWLHSNMVQECDNTGEYCKDPFTAMRKWFVSDEAIIYYQFEEGEWIMKEVMNIADSESYELPEVFDDGMLSCIGVFTCLNTDNVIIDIKFYVGEFGSAMLTISMPTVTDTPVYKHQLYKMVDDKGEVIHYTTN